MSDFHLEPEDDDPRIEERIEELMEDEAWIVGCVVEHDDIYQAVLMQATEQATQEALHWVMWKGSSEATAAAVRRAGPEDV